MATKKNSNKTAHVLHLLTNEISTADAVAESAQAKAAGSLPTPAVLDNRQAAEAAISEGIRSALESELGESPAAEQSAVSAPPPEATTSAAASAVPAPAPEAIAPAAASAAPAPAPKVTAPAAAPAAPAPTPEVTAPAAASAAPAPETAAPSEVPLTDYVKRDVICVNVMREFVNNEVGKYMDMLGVCKCSRCLADVCALALTNLPSKYVVAREGDQVPLLAMFEGRYQATIRVQLLRACYVVNNNPHHTTEDLQNMA